MTRLTNAHRDKIATMVIEHKFRPLEDAHAREAKALAVRIYNLMYTADQRRLMNELAASTPKAVFPTISALKVNAGGWEVELKFQDNVLCWYGYQSGYGTKYDITDQAVIDEVQDFATRRKDLAAERKHLEKQVEGQLAPHFTFDKLRASWPEIDRFISAVEAGLPAPPSAVALADHSALNEALDLPPETKAA